jgi:hypothetical protein
MLKIIFLFIEILAIRGDFDMAFGLLNHHVG